MDRKIHLGLFALGKALLQQLQRGRDASGFVGIFTARNVDMPVALGQPVHCRAETRKSLR